MNYEYRVASTEHKGVRGIFVWLKNNQLLRFSVRSRGDWNRLLDWRRDLSFAILGRALWCRPWRDSVPSCNCPGTYVPGY